MIISSPAHLLSVTEHAANGRVEAPFKENIENENFSCVFTLALNPLIWKLNVVIWQITSKNCTKVRAGRLLFLIQPIRSLFSGVLVAITVVLG